MNELITSSEALHYHAKGRPGKMEVIPTKEAKTQRDLSLAYSPGVAEPCLEIHKDPNAAYKYTTKGNLVAVISNGSAVLGLGDIGAQASKPVMEGKGVLFKIFADIDVFDIEINETDPQKIIAIIKSLEPTFGGINLEDIKAPECFEIESKLQEVMNIPVMHDDQHGTAIISAAALLNALELQNKDIQNVKIVVNGAGAAAISCALLYIRLGARIENITFFDSKGCISEDRSDLTSFKMPFSKGKTSISLAKAMVQADVFIGLSKANALSGDMVRTMAKNPIVFAMANPDPEITYTDAVSVRSDIIMATGRSDYPNQVNNVLGFPYIFRGALDVRAEKINDDMKIAAVYALAQLAKEPVPDVVAIAYNNKNLAFGPQYIIPTPFDPRLLAHVAPAVAKAAMDSGVANIAITDWEKYKIDLNARLGRDNQMLRHISVIAKKRPKRIIFTNPENINVLKTAQQLVRDNMGYPILIGDKMEIQQLCKTYHVDLTNITVVDPVQVLNTEKGKDYTQLFYEKMYRKGINIADAKMYVKDDKIIFGTMMLLDKEADALISMDITRYGYIVKKGLQLIGMEDNVKRVAGLYILFTKSGPLFLADTTINVSPNAEQLADIALLTAREVRLLGIEPRVALLSYSNYGSIEDEQSKMIQKACLIAKQADPQLIIDGDIQALYAFDTKTLKSLYPFSAFKEKAPNVLIFPNLAAGNITYNLLQQMNETETVGPLILGLRQPIHILPYGSTVNRIYNVAMIATLEAERLGEKL